MRKAIAFACLVLLMAGARSLSAQPCSEQSINEAVKKYEIGRFDEVFSLLEPCVKNGFSDLERVQAYKFLSYSYLAIDSISKAQNAIAELVKINPNFEPDLFAPPRFISLLAYFKEQGNRNLITSVSKRKEDIYQAPATVVVVSEEDIRRRGYTDLEEIFLDLPGFDVQRHFAQTYSNIYQRGYQSGNTDRTLFLIDGIEENDLWFMAVYWGKQFPVTNVRRVEIVYGPASTMYGANAFVGVVNVITKDPLEATRGKGISAKVNTGFGTYKHRYIDATIAGQYKNLSAQATVRRVITEERNLSGFSEYDFDPEFYNTVNYAGIRTLKLDSAGAVSFWKDANAVKNAVLFKNTISEYGNITGVTLSDSGVNFVRNADKQLFLRDLNGHPIQYSNGHEHFYLNTKLRVGDFLIGYETWVSENGIINYDSDASRAPYKNGAKWVPQQNAFYLKFDKNIGENFNISNLSTFRSSFINESSMLIDARNYHKSGLALKDVATMKEPFWRMRRFYQESKQFRNEAKLTYTIHHNIDVITGVEVRTSNIQGDYRILDVTKDPSLSAVEQGSSSLDNVPGGNSFSQIDFGAYTQGSYRPIRGLAITLGMRYDNNKIRKDGGYGGIFNPRVAIVWSRNEKFILKGIYASAFQNASNFQKYATSPGSRDLNNPTLAPEKVINYELAGAYRGIKNLYLEASYYNAFYSGAVTARRVSLPSGGTTTQYQAVGERRIWGIQAMANYKYKNFEFFANYTYVDPQNNKLDVDGNLTGQFERIGEISNHQVKFGANALFIKHLNINAKMRYMTDRPVGEGTTSPDNKLGYFPSVFLMDAAVGYFSIIKGLDLQLIVNNVLNKDYSDPAIRNGTRESFRTPQRLRNITIRMMYEF